MWEKEKMLVTCILLYCFQNPSVSAPHTKVVAYVVNVDQDEAAQNVQPDLRSTLSAMLEHYKQKVV